MASNTVIVFGPTGGVGSVVAIAAHENGAKVVLAMRDTSKSIPGLSSEHESSGSYERVQADLLNAESVSNAVRSTSAKSAFIYLAHGAPDHMRKTIEALKDGGIEFVVFLSSFTVDGKLEDIPQTEIISWMHAGVSQPMSKRVSHNLRHYA